MNRDALFGLSWMILILGAIINLFSTGADIAKVLIWLGICGMGIRNWYN